MTHLKYPTVNFRITDGMETDLESRVTSMSGTRHAVAKRDLERYYEMLRCELRGMIFSPDEVKLMLDVGKGTFWQPFSIPFLWDEIEDSLLDGTAEKWNVDGPGFVKRLKSLTPTQACAVVDALERWWIMGKDFETGARAVGLLRGQVTSATE